MANSIYELAILLSLKDMASGGIVRVEGQLRSLGREGRATIQTFQSLRENLTKNLAIAGTGIASLALMKKGIDVAADFESAMLDLRSAYQESAAAGSLSATEQAAHLTKLERLATQMGNRLQGNTQDYVGILSALKQSGVDTATVLGGAGEAASNLANVSGALIRGTAREQAKELGQFGKMFKLKGEDFIPSVNLFAALKDRFDIDSSSLIDSAKYFQTTAMSLGMTGPAGASEVSKFFALLKREGALEGSIAGTSATSFFQQFVVHADKVKKLKQETGIDVQFFDAKGQFKGLDNAFKQMEQFRKLSGQKRLEALNEVFGEQGGKVAGVMVEGGAESWRRVTAEAAKAVPVNEKINQQMETYKAKVEALTGSMVNLTAAGFMPMLETVKPIVDFANKGVSALQEWAAAHPGTAKTVGSLVGMGSVAVTIVGGIGAMSTAWRMWRIASSVGVNEAGQLTFLRTLRTETALTSATMTSGAGKVGLYTRTLGRIPPVVSTTIALVGVEFAISKTYELIGAIEDYEKARAGETKANVESMKSLAALQADFAKRGEKVPADVYSGRAATIIESLNRQGQLRESLEPGSHFFRSFARMFTMAPMNPYVGGPGQTFDPARASAMFKERAPELAVSEVMRAFIEKLKAWKLPAEQQGQPQLAEIQRRELMQALQLAFPQSYQEATSSLTQSMLDLRQPLTDMPTSMMRFGDSTTRAASNLDRFSNRLAGVEMPTTPSVTPGGQAPGAAPYNPFQLFPSRAAGGMVQSGGFVEVHDGEAIVPAIVTERFNEKVAERTQVRDEVARTIVRERQGTSAPEGRVVHLTVNISVAPSSAAADDPRELARLVAQEVQIQIERAG